MDCWYCGEPYYEDDSDASEITRYCSYQCEHDDQEANYL